MKFKVITLCGSSKFKKEFEEMKNKLIKEGNIVLSLDTFSKADNIELTDEEKKTLIEMHKQKILMSDEIMVIDKEGYIGDQTQEEIEFARKNNKVIKYMEAPKQFILENIKSTIENAVKSFKLTPVSKCKEMYARVIIESDDMLDLLELNAQAFKLAEKEVFYNNRENLNNLEDYIPKKKLCYNILIEGLFEKEYPDHVLGDKAVMFNPIENYTIKFREKMTRNEIVMRLD